MIKPIGFDDVFGYDDAGRPCAVQLHGNVYGFGYEFCRELKPLLEQGYAAAHRLFDDGSAFVFVYDPNSKIAELWKGPWREDDKHVYSIMNPDCIGLLDHKFETFDDLRDFAKSDMSSMRVSPGSLPRT